MILWEEPSISFSSEFQVRQECSTKWFSSQLLSIQAKPLMFRSLASSEHWQSKLCCATVITLKSFQCLILKNRITRSFHLFYTFRRCSTWQLSPFKKHGVETAWRLNYIHDFLNIHFKRQVSSHSNHSTKSLSHLIKYRCYPSPTRHVQV